MLETARSPEASYRPSVCPTKASIARCIRTRRGLHRTAALSVVEQSEPELPTDVSDSNNPEPPNVPDATEANEGDEIMTSEQIDRGEGMSYHPVTGRQFLFFRANIEGVCEYTGRIKVRGPGGAGWGVSVTGDIEHLPRIGDGNNHPLSDLPLPHWRFDPKTGFPLEKEG